MELIADLSPSQMKFHSSPAKYRALIGGLGSGKTWSLCLEAMKQALEFPRTDGVIVSSTFRSIDDKVMPVMKTHLWEGLGIPDGWDRFIDSFNMNTRIARLKSEYGGSAIYFRSADDPQELRGMTLGWFAIDEACVLKKQDTWDILVGRIRQKNGPRRGWIATTPKGFDWVWNVFARKPRQKYFYVHCSTEENKHLPRDYVEDLKDSYRGKFLRQEVYGEFVNYEGLVYPIVGFETHHFPAPETRDYKYAVAGVDWGWTNPTVILIGTVGMDGQIHIVDEFCQTKASKETVQETAERFQEKWGTRTHWCDPSRPDSIADLRVVGLDARKANNDIDYGITETYAKLDKRLILVDYGRCPRLVEEFGMYRYPEDDTGKILKNIPIDEDNHCMDALRYMVMGQKKAGDCWSRAA